MYWSTFWMVGGVIAAIGALVDLIWLSTRDTYCLAWHGFMIGCIIPCFVYMVDLTQDACDEIKGCHPIVCWDLQVKCACNSITTALVALIEIIEGLIMRLGRREEKRFCCYSKEPISTEMVLEEHYYQAG